MSWPLWHWSGSGPQLMFSRFGDFSVPFWVDLLDETICFFCRCDIHLYIYCKWFERLFCIGKNNFKIICFKEIELFYKEYCKFNKKGKQLLKLELIVLNYIVEIFYTMRSSSHNFLNILCMPIGLYFKHVYIQKIILQPPGFLKFQINIYLLNRSIHIFIEHNKISRFYRWNKQMDN